jgi:hypothetical protein
MGSLINQVGFLYSVKFEGAGQGERGKTKIVWNQPNSLKIRMSFLKINLHSAVGFPCGFSGRPRPVDLPGG